MKTKEKTQHTPGPWTATIGSAGAHINVGNDHNHPLSFGFSFSQHDEKQQAEGQANARIIYLSPEMVEIVREVASGYASAATMHKAEDILSRINAS